MAEVSMKIGRKANDRLGLGHNIHNSIFESELISERGGVSTDNQNGRRGDESLRLCWACHGVTCAGDPFFSL
jgi:hypothetical protein